jgi:hypothetical protein
MKRLIIIAAVLVAVRRSGAIDVRPNWNEASPVQDWRGNEAMPGGE